MLAAIAAVAVAVSRPTTVVVSLDGYRNEYMEWDKQSGKGFDVIKAAGGWAKAGMMPPRPSKTFPSHYTMATGLWPEDNGIVGNHMYDPVKGVFDPSNTPGSSGWFLGEPIWETAEKYGVSTGACYWPGSEATFAHPPTYLEPYNHTATFAHRVSIIEDWLTLPMPPALIMSYFSEPDSAGHQYGPNSTQVADVVRSLNPVVEALLNLTQAHNANLIIISDHGMSATSNDRVIPLHTLIDMTQVRPSGHSPFISLFIKDQAATDTLFAVLSKQPHMAVYKKQDIPTSWHVAKSTRVGDLVLVADDGWSITTQPGDVCCGTHGYDSAAPSQRAIFVAAGPAFRKNSTIARPFDSINLYALMCELLGIPPAPNNGTLDPFRPVLKRSPYDAQWSSSTTWQPALNALTLYPATGTIFPGTRFDISVTCPRALPGARPEELTVTANGANITSICSKAAVVTSSANYVHHTWGECSISANTTIVATSELRTVSSVLTVKDVKGQGAKNIILMIGDGMSLPMLTASRLVSRRPHATDNFEHAGTCFTKTLESIVTDSAAAASALNTGHKTINGASGVYPDSTPDFTDNPHVETVAEYVRRTFGMKIGVVSTASLVDATPAGVWTHCSARDQSSIIAQQAAAFSPDVLLGGGMDPFRPHLAQFASAGYSLYNTSADLVNAKHDSKVLGLFAAQHLATSKDREADPTNTQPGLPAMALAALDVLRKGADDRFYLMVEAASIDKMAHACDYSRMISDTLELQETVIAVQEWLAEKGIADDTLILVTSDHATGGYDVYGTVNTDEPQGSLKDGIMMYGQAGWPDWVAGPDRVVRNWDEAEWTFAGINVNHPAYKEDFKAKQLEPWWLTRQEDLAKLAGLPLADNIGDSSHHEAMKASVHTSSDVMIYASGRGSHMVRAGQENTDVFHMILSALHPAPPVPRATVDRNTVQLVVIGVYTLLLGILAGVIWRLYVTKGRGPSECYTVELSEIAQDFEEPVNPSS
eukprot:TRINITY_DN5661_c0_g1_i1.p1 TRINITY_DN5661_c0_g1~~TRINITY_DN5661_c0_g1_i1.p1  ORF type:complete len:992 (+),score=227.26 TRINITY_DN5661_c0_g1_i1:118-3093(+)